MKKTVTIGLATMLAVLAAPLGAGHGGAHAVDVTVDDYSFDPAILDIEAGTPVRWTNVGPSVHEVAVHVHNPVHGAGPHMVPTGVSTNDPAAGPYEPFMMVLLEAEDDPATPEDERVFEYTFEEPGVFVINCNLGGEHEAMKQVIRVLSDA